MYRFPSPKSCSEDKQDCRQGHLRNNRASVRSKPARKNLPLAILCIGKMSVPISGFSGKLRRSCRNPFKFMNQDIIHERNGYIMPPACRCPVPKPKGNLPVRFLSRLQIG